MSVKDYSELSFYKKRMEPIKIEEVDESWALNLLDETEQEKDQTQGAEQRPCDSTESSNHSEIIRVVNEPSNQVRDLAIEGSASNEMAFGSDEEEIVIDASILSLSAIELQLLEQIDKQVDDESLSQELEILEFNGPELADEKEPISFWQFFLRRLGL